MSSDWFAQKCPKVFVNGFQTSINASHGYYYKITLFILYPNEGITVEITKTSGGKASPSEMGN